MRNIRNNRFVEVFSNFIPYFVSASLYLCLIFIISVFRENRQMHVQLKRDKKGKEAEVIETLIIYLNEN